MQSKCVRYDTRTFMLKHKKSSNVAQKKESLHLLGIQAVVILLCCVYWGARYPSLTPLVSALCGGTVVMLSQAWGVSKMLHRTDTSHPLSILKNLYLVTAYKWFFVILVSLGLFYRLSLLAFPFFLTYIITQLATLMGCYSMLLSERSVE